MQKELTVLRERIRVLSAKEKDTLAKKTDESSRAAALSAALIAAQKKSAEAEQQLLRSNEKIRSLTLELERVRKDLASARKKWFDSVREKNGESQRKTASLEQELSSLRKELASSRKKTLDLSGKLIAENSRVIRLQEELLQIRKESVSISGKNTRDQKVITDLQLQLTTLRRDLESARKEAAVVSGSAAASRAQVHTLQGKLASAAEIARVREQDLKVLRAELERVRMEFTALKTRSERTEAESGKELALLRKQAAETPLRFAAQRKTLEEKDQALGKVQKSLQENVRLLAERDKEILKLKEQIRLLRSTLVSTGAERSVLVKDLETLKKSLPRKEELSSARKRITDMQSVNEGLRKEKSALEQTISSLQFRLGSTQTLLEKVRKEALRQSAEIGDLKNQNHVLQSRITRAGSLEKSLAASREERNRLIRNAAVTEKRLKDQLRQYASEILTMRDASVQQKESLRIRERKIASLQKDLKDSGSRIVVLQKKLADALSGEERRQLVKQIESLTKAMKVLSSSSPDELVREAADKNLVITELLGEIRGYKGQLKTMQNEVENNRLAVLRSRDEILQAQEGARLAVEGARLARAELSVLKAEVLSGSVNVTLLERSAPKVKMTADGRIASGNTLSSGGENGKIRDNLPPRKGSVVSKRGRELKKEPSGRKAVSHSPAAAVQKTSGGEKVLPAKYQEVMKQALACEKSGDLGMALFHYWNAVDLLPAHPETYLSLAKLHLKRKEAESARKAYNKAISLGGAKDPVLDSQIRLLEEREE